MNSPRLPPLTISDLQTGSDYLARLPLAEPPKAAAALAQLFSCLQTAPPDVETYFRILEQARLPLAQVCDELAKRYVGKPLPFGDIEDSLFDTVVGLWRDTAKCYAQCGELKPVHDEDAATHDRRLATLLHRCLLYTGLTIYEHQRARREYPWGLWLDFHGYFASAEEWALEKHPVADVHEILGRSTNCLSAYLVPILTDMAGCYRLSARELALTFRWARYWSNLVSIETISAGENTPAFVIDLMQDTALLPMAECLKTDQMRRLDTSRLAVHLTQIRQQLRQKVPPSQLALGSDCTTSQCARLLGTIAKPWSQARAARKFRRHNTTGVTQLCSGFEEMHYYISGREFEQPENVRTYSRREFESMFVFRQQDDPQQMLQVRKVQLGYALDSWEVVNQSANGFRLMRSVTGKRMTHGQLLALCPHDGEHFLLAKATWLMQEKESGLIAGILTLPGIPSAIAARRMDAPPESQGIYERAFLLPAKEPISSEPSLVLHSGWYRAGRLLEIYTDGPWQVRLTGLIDEGSDFEHVSFVLC